METTGLDLELGRVGQLHLPCRQDDRIDACRRQ